MDSDNFIEDLIMDEDYEDAYDWYISVGCWCNGVVHWKIKPHQLRLGQYINASQLPTRFWNKASRKTDKYRLYFEAVQLCLDNPTKQEVHQDIREALSTDEYVEVMNLKNRKEEKSIKNLATLYPMMMLWNMKQEQNQNHLKIPLDRLGSRMIIALWKTSG
ncbi:hypothetical protein BDQ12DRAFT_669216 [Crucibulum laeve]|uniref:Uncharacterized protein n=1 Tax=Crucibulum laeve TaxID=68775 RepID=A0A5C3LNL6_9AGAR|nr:hypothetical protein BDQ12DRAFT_669216 [Crucibulum laeve]